MTDTTEYPSQDDLDVLQELMERVGEDADRVEKVVQVAAVDIEFYEDMRGIYQRKAAQIATKDAYYPYTALNGEFMIGTDPWALIDAGSDAPDIDRLQRELEAVKEVV